jgi:tight adherence protein C
VGSVTIDTAFAAVCFGAAAAGTSFRALHVRRSPAVRMDVYLETARGHLGERPRAGHALVAGEAMRRVLGPLGAAALSLLGRVVRFGQQRDIELAIRRAGMDMDLATYRREYLRWLLGAPIALGLLGVLTGRASYVVGFFLAGLVVGARRLPERLRARTRRRCERMRSDLPTVVSVLALKIDNNKTLSVAVNDLVRQGSGPVIKDLDRALHLVNAGYGEASAFGLIARECCEPAAARFYRFLAAAVGGGVDLAAALLDQANELRAQRREEVERSAAKRQMSMVVPNLVFMAPVLFIFLLAPVPEMLFGK